MKIRHYLSVVIIAALVATLVKGPNIDGPLIHNPLTNVLEKFLPTAHAQGASGYKNWNNIQMVHLGADSSDSATGGTGLQAMQGMAMVFPAQGAQNWWYDCQLYYSQATAAVADGFGLSFSNAPTASNNMSFVSITAATAPLGGVVTNITNTSSTAILPAFTPSATSTVYTANLKGYVEMPSTTIDTTVQVYMSQATQGDVLTLKRDSACMWHSIN